MRSTRFRPPHAVDVRRTLAALRQGPQDPTLRERPDGLWRATRTPDGPATLRITASRGEIEGRAWGPGAGWALDHLGDLVGATDDAAGIEAAVASNAVLHRLHRRHGAVRLTRTLAVYEALVRTVCGQKVTGEEAHRSFAAIIRRFGTDAPEADGGPRLRLLPAPGALASQPSWAFHRLGLERKRAETIIRVARNAARLEQASGLPAADARRRLRAIDGIGVWSAAEVARVALGDGDAVSVGDYHVPTLVTYALAGEERGDDARMLELLEPFRPHRGRVQRLLEVGHPMPPRRGPRMPLRRFEDQ